MGGRVPPSPLVAPLLSSSHLIVANYCIGHNISRLAKCKLRLFGRETEAVR